MHEFSLYGSVPVTRHGKLLKQLAGYSCMQPQDVREMHLVFKASSPPGATRLQQGNTGGSQAVSQQQQDVQKLKTMLQSGIYFVKLIGTISLDSNDSKNVKWTFEFKDSPEAGQQKTNAQSIWRMQIEDGKILAFLKLFGYEYIHRYMLEGQRFYTRDTTIFLQRVRLCPKLADGHDPLTTDNLPLIESMELLDSSGAYMVEASIEAVDGRNQDLRDRAEKQLASLQTDLASAIKLEKPDRLALETRVSVARG